MCIRLVLHTHVKNRHAATKNLRVYISSSDAFVLHLLFFCCAFFSLQLSLFSYHNWFEDTRSFDLHLFPFFFWPLSCSFQCLSCVGFFSSPPYIYRLVRLAWTIFFPVNVQWIRSQMRTTTTPKITLTNDA